MSAILYSFRRCPYAIRARYALTLLEVSVQLREVVLKNKPQALLELGGRTTVPQLLVDGTRYPESLDIMFWALSNTQNTNVAEQLWPSCRRTQVKIHTWISYNDRCFKPWLDRYKYADRHPEHSEAYYRAQCERFLTRIEYRLSKQPFLVASFLTLADIAVFPFIRQFSAVNASWFELSDYPFLKKWLNGFLKSEPFVNVMKKYPAWNDTQGIVYFP